MNSISKLGDGTTSLLINILQIVKIVKIAHKALMRLRRIYRGYKRFSYPYNSRVNRKRR